MATSQHIDPFPSDTDRDAFGHWLSGFTDGEACFYLGWRQYADCKRRTPRAIYEIKLRADDAPILKSIQSYWGCGYLFSHAKCYRPHSDTKPSRSYHVRRISEIIDVVIPHFERFPLRAKKVRDFQIWKEGATLLHTVTQRSVFGRRGKGGGGTHDRWSAEEYAHFFELVAHLRSQREYNSAHCPPPGKETPSSLFDGVS